MAGIYLHIPFCSKACHYCNFHFSTSLHRKADMVAALEAEIRSLPKRHPDYQRQAATLYFGGGTPSVLSFPELVRLITAVQQTFDLHPEAEITLEANPDDIRPEALQQWRQAGINRLSVGIQSFDDGDLRWMNRAHNASQSLKAIADAHKAGFTNISIDLIYGLPHQTQQQWLHNLQQAFSLPIQHLSAYALTVEPRTALDLFIRRGKATPPDEQAQLAAFEELQQQVKAQNWEAYEISNYARPGYRSRHNSSYWQGLPYYGFGPSAHSFDGQRHRWWNIANNALYMQGMEAHAQPPLEEEWLTTTERLNEQIMTSLRQMEGLPSNADNLTIGHTAVSKDSFDRFARMAQRYIDAGLLQWQNQAIQLTATGRFRADGIAADLFLEED